MRTILSEVLKGTKRNNRHPFTSHTWPGTFVFSLTLTIASESFWTSSCYQWIRVSSKDDVISTTMHKEKGKAGEQQWVELDLKCELKWVERKSSQKEGDRIVTHRAKWMSPVRTGWSHHLVRTKYQGSNQTLDEMVIEGQGYEAKNDRLIISYFF